MSFHYSIKHLVVAVIWHYINKIDNNTRKAGYLEVNCKEIRKSSRLFHTADTTDRFSVTEEHNRFDGIVKLKVYVKKTS